MLNNESTIQFKNRSSVMVKYFILLICLIANIGLMVVLTDNSISQTASIHNTLALQEQKEQRVVVLQNKKSPVTYQPNSVLNADILNPYANKPNKSKSFAF